MIKRAIVLALALMLGSCVGIHIGVPGGSVQVGTLITPNGDIGVSTPAGSVWASGKMLRQQTPFTDLPVEEETGGNKELEQGKKS